MEFVGFPKIARYSRDCVITEKIDGTNAQVHIMPLDSHTNIINDFKERGWAVIKSGLFSYGVVPCSRNKHITPNKDNYGFAKWVLENAEELLKLGHGRHFGEWWGEGIQRGYNMDRKVFSLFNTHRWSDLEIRPKCCDVVPVIYEGIFCEDAVNDAIEELGLHGSIASKGFMKPEGIVIFHTAKGYLFKKIVEKDEKPKSSKE